MSSAVGRQQSDRVPGAEAGPGALKAPHTRRAFSLWNRRKANLAST